MVPASPRRGTPAAREMGGYELKALLDEVPDTRELILRRGTRDDVLRDVWREAREEARRAYGAWRSGAGAEAYAAYRAAQDREDAAQDALALAAI